MSSVTITSMGWRGSGSKYIVQRPSRLRHVGRGALLDGDGRVAIDWSSTERQTATVPTAQSLPGFAYWPDVSRGDELYDRVTDVWPRREPVPSPAIAVILESSPMRLKGEGDAIVGLGSLRRGAAITTFGRRIGVSDIRLITQPLLVRAVLERLPARTVQTAQRALLGGGRIPPATWAAIRAVLSEHPDLGPLLDELDRRGEELPSWVREETQTQQILTFEYDAVGIALEATGVDRRELRTWVPPQKPAPFLTGIQNTVLIEDQILVHDFERFGDWDRSGANGLSAVFTDRGGRRVHVMNVNRHRLESTIGADLIYYNEPHKAFTVVQYKRMRLESRSAESMSQEPVYRAGNDRNLPKQLRRMSALEAGMRDPRVGSLEELRLGNSMCFLKFCDPRLDLRSDDLVKGMYVSLDVWSMFNRWRGDKVSYRTMDRYLTNTDFLRLVGDGWIGSAGEVTTVIEAYITGALRNKHSVTLAVGSA